MKKTLIIVLIALALVTAGYVFWVQNGGLTWNEGKSYVKFDLPDNPYITPDQEFLFTNRPRSYSTAEDTKEYLKTASLASVDTNRVVLDGRCMPNPAVVKAYTDRDIIFENSSPNQQKLAIGKFRLLLQANETRKVRLLDINPEYIAPNKVTVTPYGCEGATERTTGFLVTFPD